MNQCDTVQRALTSDEAVDPAHLATCADCQRFVATHRSALSLRALVPQRRTRVSRRGVLARAVVMGLVLLSAGVLTTRQLTNPAPVAAAPVDADAEWNAFVAFTKNVDSITSTASADSTLQPFGALPRWFAPATTLTALEN